MRYIGNAEKGNPPKFFLGISMSVRCSAPVAMWESGVKKACCPPMSLVENVQNLPPKR